MISYNIINRSKPKYIILIHGLFTGAGYWLPYLGYFRNYKLVILNINYLDIVNTETYITIIKNIINSLGGKPKFIISHSLGSLLSSSLSVDSYSLSIEICPVYCSSRINNDDFIYEIKNRLGLNECIDSIVSNLINADIAIQGKKEISSVDFSNIFRFLPDNDKYFLYDKSFLNVIYFDGDHFDISCALDKIKILLL